MDENFQLAGLLEISGTIRCRTGLHVGGNPEGFQGIRLDSPVVRDPMTGFPYIPGSSLKGKLRALVELALGRYGRDRGAYHPCSCNACPICRIFGVGAKNRSTKGDVRGPTRLVVQDSFPEGFAGVRAVPDEGTTAARWERLPTALPYTEWKKENSLDRITSAASPRDVERVPAGSVFGFAMVYQLYEPADADALPVLFLAMELLERNYLGGSGSRGYGKVSLAVQGLVLVPREALLGSLGGGEPASTAAVLPGVADLSDLKSRIAGALRSRLFQGEGNDPLPLPTAGTPLAEQGSRQRPPPHPGAS
ncbi:MAG: type III-A CRISPR-associated RAMP protein Csm3 [Planctomycetes bacterium]|nr:type III-A CRISPR-associated RAMP protein Csm3 [Planctomycetota bacterium]